MEIITRKKAKEYKLLFYFTNKLCKNGHISIRYVSNGKCKICSQKIHFNAKYYYKDLEKTREKTRLRRNKNRYEYNKKRKLTRKKPSHNEHISNNLRTRLNVAIKRNYKKGSAVKDLGCSIEEFKSYIESLFQPGMTWENYGVKGWHFDHIKPLASFELTDRNQFLEAMHYSNYQPLWAIDNLKKGSKI